MAIFYQQSGKRGEVDFLKTIATQEGALRFFTVPELRDLYGYDTPPEALLNVSSGGGFQVWGVPSGARRVIAGLQPGDIMLLIGQLSPHALDYARFFYAGKITHIVPGEQFDLSRKLWGDGGFPIIFFMQGGLIDYAWRDFTNDFGLSPNYYVAGQTMRLKPERLDASPYGHQDAFAERLGLGAETLRFTHPVLPDQLGFEEGARSLRSHVALERSKELIKEFKAQLADFSCSICGFDFERTYGTIGSRFIEAHHVEPLAQRGVGLTKPEDLIGVCANCHRMLHRKWPSTDVGALKAMFAENKKQ